MGFFSRKKGNAVTAVAMAATLPVQSQDSAIDALIAEMSNPTPAEPTAPAPVSESDLEAAVAGAELAETYAQQPGDKTAEQIEAEKKAANERAKAEAKAQREREKAEKKAAREAQKADAKAKREQEASEKKAARETEKQRKADERAAKKAEREAAKLAKPKRVFFGADKVSRLKHSMGEKFGDYMVLTTADATLTGDELAAKQQETVEIIEKMGVKVKNRATFLLDFVSGKTSKLNNVLEIGLRTLSTDGKIVTGDKGNFHTALLAKPYAPSAARAMGNNTVAMFRLLKLIVGNGDKQTYVANPDSLLLAAAKSKLGI
jgi:flagellar biosynthesis GTPase FlhF